MYICLKNTENTQNIVESLKAFGEEIYVNDLETLTYIKIATNITSSISAYFTKFFSTDSFTYHWAVRVYEKEDHANALNIKIEEIETLFDL